jgi:PTS system mannitol-specific IIC component
MSTTHASPRPGLRVQVQRFGTFLSNMIMPNIGAIIAWGLITAFFIPDGWTPNEKIATVVGPTIFYLLPILIAYTGGRIVYDVRGGVVGAMATMGVIMGTSDPLLIGDDGNPAPMFLGAMIMGPLGAWVMKQLDRLWEGKVKPGFEMLVNNFSAGIAAAAMAIGSMFLLAPVLRQITSWLGDIVDVLVDNDVLPLTSILIEPAKVLFLNNAINHGVLTPLGLQEATEHGKSVLFLLEANPGPGLGLLLAYTVFGSGMARASAPGAAIIHFLGGIHEVYFPYVLMKPKLILAMIAGGMTGILVNVVFDVGLRAPAAPGSIIAVYAQTASDSYVGVTLSVLLAAAVTFLVAGLLLKTERAGADDLGAATARMEEMKGRKSVASTLVDGQRGAGHPIRSIVFACDAGMGSSAMGASVLRKKVHGAGFGDVTVVNKAIANLTDDFDVVVSHRDLTARAQQKAGSAVHVSVEDFMNSPAYDEIVELVRERSADAAPAVTPAAEPAAGGAAGGPVLDASAVVLDAVGTREDAITTAGELLVAAGAVDTSYVAAMHARERSVSTYMGNQLALPHGTNEAKPSIRRTALSFVRYPDGVDWNGKPVKFVVGVAAVGDDHLKVLARIAEIFADEAQVARLEAADSVEEVLSVLGTAQPV